MKKCIIKTTAVLLALLFTISSGVIVNGTGSSLEIQEPSEICSEKEGTSKTLYLKVPYYNDEQSLSTKATTYYDLGAEVGDEYELYVTVTDSFGNPINNFNGTVTWSTNNSDGLSYTVDDNDSTHCFVTILSYEYGDVVLTASVNGNSTKYRFSPDNLAESFLYSDSRKYYKELASYCTCLCEAANSETSDNIKKEYKNKGYIDVVPQNYGGDSAYAIGYKSVNNTTILTITARGTTTASEGIGDFFHGGDSGNDFPCGKIYHNVFEFEEQVWGGLNDYINNHSNIVSAENLKILITGHSLGGACASSLAARIDYYIDNFSNEYSWLKNISKNSVFAYTFGGIKTLTQNDNIEDNYENIHNVYNYFDDWGPYGKNSFLGVGAFNQKFGHTELFVKDYNGDNHNIANYRDAIENDIVATNCKDFTPGFDQDFWVEGKKGTVRLSFDETWFNIDSYHYNKNICDFSAKFAMLGYDQGDSNGNRNELKAGLEGCGFSNYTANFDTGEHEVNYFIASQEIFKDKNPTLLIVMGLIGTKDYQWYSDFDCGLGTTHNGFSEAEDYAYKKLYNYYYPYRDQYSADNIKFLILGHSRGAAAANILAADLIKGTRNTTINYIAVNNNNIYAFGFATPKFTRNQNDADYNCIFNIVNPEDFVTKCMPDAWGYKRYGKTYTLPSKTNTASSNYNYYYLKMNKYFSQYYGGESYFPFEKGEEATYWVVNSITSTFKSVNDYDNDSKRINGITLRQYFNETICKILANEKLAKKYGGDFQKNTDDAMSELRRSMVGCNVFADIAFYFIGNEGWGQIVEDWSKMSFSNAHSMHTYCAYVSAFADRLNSFSFKGYYNSVNCPVDVEIYEKATGVLVGRIKDNAVDEEIAAKPNSVVMTVNGDSKSFWLPSDGDYDVKLIGNDNGTMDYTLAEIDSDAGEVKRVNYFDVPITKNEAWSGTTSSEDFEIEEHTLTSDNGTVLTYTEDINEEEKKFSIDINIEGNGSADTSRTAVSGDYVAVTATPDEGNTFDGWYENGELLTSDAEYAFVAKSNRTLKAKFSENAAEQKYTATFIADGKVIKTVEFSAGTATIEEPDVPYKEGYTGRWSEYVLVASDITINAIYEKVSDNNPTANAVINVAGEKTIKYRTKVTIKATATNLDSKYHLVLCINGKEIKGNNKEVSYEYGELRNDVNYTVKIVDESNITQKDKEGKELKKSGGKITCNAGFFVRLIAFFQGLFNALPSETVEPK